MKTGRKFNVKRLILVIACGAILCGSIVGTLAWLTANDTVNNQFTPGVVGCLVNETIADGKKTNVYITNETGNVTAYIRVSLVSVVRNDKNEIIVVDNLGAPTITGMDSKWKSGPGGYYYYTDAVAPNGSTNAFATEITPPVVPEGCTYELQILAQSIQAEGTDAAKVWGVTVNTDGTLSIS